MHGVVIISVRFFRFVIFLQVDSLSLVLWNLQNWRLHDFEINLKKGGEISPWGGNSEVIPTVGLQEYEWNILQSQSFILLVSERTLQSLLNVTD